jgi:hypothetical protein
MDLHWRRVALLGHLFVLLSLTQITFSLFRFPFQRIFLLYKVLLGSMCFHQFPLPNFAFADLSLSVGVRLIRVLHLRLLESLRNAR